MTRFYKGIFTALFCMAFMLPSFAIITAIPNPPTAGCQANFTTTVINGTNYVWNFGPNAYPATLSGPAMIASATAFLTPGSHTVIVDITTNGGPIQETLTVTVTAGAAAPTVTTSKPVCWGTPITYTASNGFTQYAFFQNDSLRQLDTAHAFTRNIGYGDSIRVFGFNGTCFSAGATLRDGTPVVPTLTSTAPNDSICSGQTVTFTIGPSVFDSVLFYVGGSLQQGSRSNSWTTSTLSDGNIVTAYAISNGCRNPYPTSPADTFDVRPTPVISLEGDTTICQGASVTFIVHNNSLGNSTLENYSFTVNSEEEQSGADSTYTTSSLANNDLVIATGTLNGCVSKPITVSMNVFNTPSVTLNSPGNICKDDTAVFTASPGGFSNYQFFKGSTVVQNGTSPALFLTDYKAGDQIYVVATESGCGSGRSDTTTIIITPSPNVNPGPDGSLCANDDTIMLTGYGPVGGWWSGIGITDTANGIFNPQVSGAGSFALTYSYTDPETGCTGRNSAQWKVNAFELVNFYSVVDICVNGAQLNADGADTYQWSPPEGLSCTTCPNPIATPTSSTKYYLLATKNSTGCSDFDSVIVNTNGVDAETAFTDTTIAPGESVAFVITITGGREDRSYAWTPGLALDDSTTQNAVATPDADVTYRMLVTSGLCTDSVKITVHVVENDTATRIPSAFTPNNDTKNDVFGPVFKAKTAGGTIKEFRVYNRYGQMVHEDTKGWDGKFKGSDQPVGTYIYYMTISFPGQDDKQYKGAVTLLR